MASLPRRPRQLGSTAPKALGGVASAGRWGLGQRMGRPGAGKPHDAQLRIASEGTI